MTTYNVYRNGEKVASGLKEKAFTDTGLTPNTSYEYQVSAENSTGESELSDPVNVKTKYSDPASIEVSPKTNNLEVDATRSLTATVLPETAKQTVTWASSDDATVSVDSNGKVTAVKAGSAIITATSTDNASIKGTATVNVTEPEPPADGEA